MKIILMLLFPAIGFGQVVYEGNVINIGTKEKVPFATVGLMKENTGTNADGQGRFNLTKNKNYPDTLLISCVGYVTLKVFTGQLPSNMQFEIEQKQISLEEIIVGDNYKTTSELNEFSNCGINYYTTSGSVTQMAQHFQSPVTNALLSEINICKEMDDAIFRVRIYSMDSITGKPFIDLADTIIEVKSGRRHAHVDVEKYKIRIPGKDFFIAIEWLAIPYNTRKAWYRIDGKKIHHPEYSPYISFRARKGFGDNDEVWSLSYQGSWRKLYEQGTMLISAKAKY